MPEPPDPGPGASESGRLAAARRKTHTALEPLRTTVSAARQRVGSALAPVVEPPMRVLGWCGRVLGRVADLVWRVPLIVAASAMGVAGVLHARGNTDLAWTLVTAGFAIGLLGVPLGLVSVGLGRDRESDPKPETRNESADSSAQAEAMTPG